MAEFIRDEIFAECTIALFSSNCHAHPSISRVREGFSQNSYFETEDKKNVIFKSEAGAWNFKLFSQNSKTESG